MRFKNSIVTKKFCSSATFSEVKIVLNPRFSVALRNLVQFDYRILCGANEDENVTKAVEKLLTLLQSTVNITVSHENLESVVFPEIVKVIFSPISKSVVLEEKYKNVEGVQTENLGMGAYETWHGCPDGRVRGFTYDENTEVDTEVISVYPSPAGDDDEEGEVNPNTSDGTTTSIDGKRALGVEHVSQLVATNVISSFVENNNHPTLNPLIPSIMVGCNSFEVSLYDCKRDILLISNWINMLCDSNDGVKRSALLLIWIFINHR